MKTIKCDAKGRLYLQQSLRKRYGDTFITVPTPTELLLFPIPRDPVADLREATKKLRGKSIEELRAAIERAARRQVRR